MVNSSYIFWIFSAMILFISVSSQTLKLPVAKFSFNDKKDYDEISKRGVKLRGANFTDDRFGNPDHAIFLSGHEESYVNLGNFPALKLKTASISLWVKIYEKVWAGCGHRVNPVLVTKSTTENDFYESYAIYYTIEGENINTCSTRDSLKQISICSSQTFERFKWHHLVITYDDRFYTFYVDAKKESSVSKGYETKFLATDSVVLGTTANKKNNRYLMGAIDDVEFYDYVLTQAEVKNLNNEEDPNKNHIIFKRLMMIFVFGLFIFSIYSLVKYRFNLKLKKEKQKLEQENKLLETELKVNRASMSPHFLFNSLNALHNFILAEETNNASNYLIKFSKLIRKIIESNMYDSISLKLEIEMLEYYLEVENMRFKENIMYTFITDDSLSASSVHIPVMMLQPFVENAIWHGLLNKSGDKIITVSFSVCENKYLYCIIEDNGIGRKTGKSNLSGKKSLAIGFILQRLELLNKIHDLNCSLIIEDKPLNRGTIVKITLPILNKPL